MAARLRELGGHRVAEHVAARVADERGVDALVDHALAELAHGPRRRGEGVVVEAELADAVAVPEELHELDHLRDGAAAEGGLRGVAEGARAGAPAGHEKVDRGQVAVRPHERKIQVEIDEVIGGKGVPIEVHLDGARRVVHHPAVDAVAQPRDGVVGATLHELEHERLAVAAAHGVEGPVAQHLLGARLGVNAAAEHLAVGHLLFAHRGDVVRGHDVAAQHRDAHEARPQRAQHVAKLRGVKLLGVQVDDVHVVALRLEVRRDRENSQGRQHALQSTATALRHPDRIDEEHVGARTSRPFGRRASRASSPFASRPRRYHGALW